MYLALEYWLKLRSRRLQVVGARKNGRTRGRNAGGDGAWPLYIASTLFTRVNLRAFAQENYATVEIDPKTLSTSLVPVV